MNANELNDLTPDASTPDVKVEDVAVTTDVGTVVVVDVPVVVPVAEVVAPVVAPVAPVVAGPRWADTAAVTRQKSRRGSFLRTAILGSSDAVISLASLIIGLSAAGLAFDGIVAATVIALVAGALSMGVSELVRVAAQRADVPARDALGELPALPEPMHAAGIASASFALFAAIPLVMLLVTSDGMRVPGVAAISLVCLAAVSGLGARLAGSPLAPAIARMTIGGAIAMTVTGLIGLFVGLGVA